MKREHAPLGKDHREELRVLRHLGKIDHAGPRGLGSTKQLRKVQGTKAGHVRGGHSFH